MRSRGQSPAHAEAVSRRLALLSSELIGVREPPGGERADGERADVEAADVEAADDGETRGGGTRQVLRAVAIDPAEEHTRIREFRPMTSASPAGPPITAAPPVASVRPAPSGLSDAGAKASEPPPIPLPGRHAARRGGRWLDVSALRGRVALGPAQAAVVAVLAVIAMAVTTWWVLRDDPGSVAGAPIGGAAMVSIEPGSAPPGVVGPDGAVPPATPPSELVVDVAGKVARPGIVVLTPGARVVDALEAAGGVRKGADLTGLNQARPLVDGEQVRVGIPAPPGHAASAAPGAPGAPRDAAALVNLNTATVSQLTELPGVGPVTAQSIVTWRESTGGFATVDQLLEVDGIGEKTLAKLAPHVTL